MIYHFIVNPRARSGLGEMLWKQLEPELCRKRIDYQIHLTTKKKDAGKIASEITEDGQEHMFVVLGGDGTLNEVLSGIKSWDIFRSGQVMILQEEQEFREILLKHWTQFFHPKRLKRWISVC